MSKVRTSFWGDTFEKLGDLVESTAEKTGKAIKETVSPGSLWEEITGTGSNPGSPDLQKEQEKQQNNHTKLDLKELQKNYQNQDQQKEAALRNRLFQLVKSGDEKAVQEKEKEQKEKEQKLMYEQQEKRRHQEEQKRMQEQSDTPHGKERKSIFGKKKKKARPQPNTAELKPSKGKQ